MYSHQVIWKIVRLWLTSIKVLWRGKRTYNAQMDISKMLVGYRERLTQVYLVAGDSWAWPWHTRTGPITDVCFHSSPYEFLSNSFACGTASGMMKDVTYFPAVWRWKGADTRDSYPANFPHPKHRVFLSAWGIWCCYWVDFIAQYPWGFHWWVQAFQSLHHGMCIWYYIAWTKNETKVRSGRGYVTEEPQLTWQGFISRINDYISSLLSANTKKSESSK